MRIIYNNLIPFNGFIAINLFGILFVRSKAKHKLKQTTINHEMIHTAQMKELLYIPFYLIYLVEWLCKLLNHSAIEAYRNISFEREAYENESNIDYLKNRSHFAQWRTKAGQ